MLLNCPFYRVSHRFDAGKFCCLVLPLWALLFPWWQPLSLPCLVLSSTCLVNPSLPKPCIVGFLTCSYLSGTIFVSGMEVTILGAALAALVIGVIDAFVPTELRQEVCEPETAKAQYPD